MYTWILIAVWLPQMTIVKVQLESWIKSSLVSTATANCQPQILRFISGFQYFLWTSTLPLAHLRKYQREPSILIFSKFKCQQLLPRISQLPFKKRIKVAFYTVVGQLPHCTASLKSHIFGYKVRRETTGNYFLKNALWPCCFCCYPSRIEVTFSSIQSDNVVCTAFLCGKSPTPQGCNKLFTIASSSHLFERSGT